MGFIAEITACCCSEEHVEVVDDINRVGFDALSRDHYALENWRDKWFLLLWYSSSKHL
jgi:hypothetical protein